MNGYALVARMTETNRNGVLDIFAKRAYSDRQNAGSGRLRAAC
jgi:hypothetical protein